LKGKYGNKSAHCVS